MTLDVWRMSTRFRCLPKIHLFDRGCGVHCSDIFEASCTNVAISLVTQGGHFPDHMKFPTFPVAWTGKDYRYTA